jgi:hypothetical protein
MRIFGKRLAMLGLSLALMLGVFSIPAGAHFMWINAGDYTPPTEREAGEVYHWMGACICQPCRQCHVQTGRS